MKNFALFCKNSLVMDLPLHSRCANHNPVLQLILMKILQSLCMYLKLCKVHLDFVFHQFLGIYVAFQS